jgi:hypothetical protein
MIKVVRFCRFLLFLLFLLVIFAGTQAAGSPVEKKVEKEHEGIKAKVSVHVSENEITIADSIRLKVEAFVPKGYDINLPSFSEYGFSSDFNERSKRFRPTDITEIKKTETDAGATLYTQEFTLEPWLSGNYSILPLMFSFFKQTDPKKANKRKAEERKDSKDETSAFPEIPDFNIITDGIRIKVSPLPEKRDDIADLFGQSDYKMERLKKRQRRKEDMSEEELRQDDDRKKEESLLLKKKGFPWWVVLVLLFAGLATAIYKYFGKEKIAGFFTPKKEPSHEIAYRELLELKSKRMPAQGMAKEYYYELSYILRKYIGNRFNIFAINQTSEEFFLKLLKSNPFDKEVENILREFSDLADTVKYSRYRPDTEISDESFKVSKSFVDSTKMETKEN